MALDDMQSLDFAADNMPPEFCQLKSLDLEAPDLVEDVVEVSDSDVCQG